MQREQQLMQPLAHRQRGITLIESLVAILVAALGILGILGVQMRTLTDTQTGVHRAQAIRLIEDLSERLAVNPNALADLASYTSAFSSQPVAVPTACAAAGACNRTNLASYDLAIWKQAVRNTLPLGQADVFIAPGETAATNNRRLLGVMIAWRQNERTGADSSYLNNIDATQIRNDANGTFTTGADATNACPASFTCQLQYIPVAARCAPYFPGGAAVAYYCPGP